MADLAQDHPTATPVADPPSGPTQNLTAPLIRPPGIDRFSRQRLKAIGLERAPAKDFYHFVLSRSWPVFFLLIGLFFLMTNLVFAWLYMARPGSVTNAHTFEEMFYFSVQTLATIGYGGLAPATRYAHLIVALEAIVGIVSFALVTGITFNRFARPSARVLFSNRIVISRRNGVPHLMFRMANWRRNQIVQARLSVVLLVTDRTAEGDVMRRQIDLPLVRERTGVFFLTWTAMHLIDEKSPFFGPGALDRLRAQQAEIYLGLTGLDETIGQVIHVRRQYNLEDVVPSARFADVLSSNPDGSRVIDYRKFHDVIEEALPPSP